MVVSAGRRPIIDLYLSLIVVNGSSQASCFSKEKTAPAGAVTSLSSISKWLEKCFPEDDLTQQEWLPVITWLGDIHFTPHL